MSYMARAFRAMAALRTPARGTRTRTARTKPPYRPGTISVSSVSEAIHRDYGAILSRRERRQLAKYGKPFRPYYNWR